MTQMVKKCAEIKLNNKIFEIFTSPFCHYFTQYHLDHLAKELSLFDFTESKMPEKAFEKIRNAFLSLAANIMENNRVATYASQRSTLFADQELLLLGTRSNGNNHNDATIPSTVIRRPMK